MQMVFVTGTDTGVGKTHVSCLLIRQLRRSGVRVGACKPVCSGSVTGPGGNPVWEDIAALREACGGLADDRVICPQRFHAAVAPNVAARLEGRIVSDQQLQQCTAAWEGLADYLVVEGAGGLLSPLSDRMTSLDLAEALQSPMLVVAANRLGVINHTRLTVEAIRSRGLPVIAIVLNDVRNPAAGDDAAATADVSLPSNGDQLRHWIPDVPLLSCGWQSQHVVRTGGLPDDPDAAGNLIRLLCHGS